MVREERCSSSLILTSIIGWILALAVLFISSKMVIAGLSDPDKATSVKSALEICFGGVFTFFSALFIAFLSVSIAANYEENRWISFIFSAVGIISFISAIATIIFISIKYPIFVFAFAFLLLQIFLWPM